MSLLLESIQAKVTSDELEPYIMLLVVLYLYR